MAIGVILSSWPLSSRPRSKRKTYWKRAPTSEWACQSIWARGILNANCHQYSMPLIPKVRDLINTQCHCRQGYPPHQHQHHDHLVLCQGWRQQESKEVQWQLQSSSSKLTGLFSKFIPRVRRSGNVFKVNPSSSEVRTSLQSHWFYPMA